MLKKVDRLVCAWISLMLEKHTDRTGLELKDVLFTREELANRAAEGRTDPEPNCV